MSEKKIIRSVAIGVVLGCILTYILLLAFDRLGWTFAAVSDQMGILLSLFITVLIFFIKDNRDNVKDLRKAIEINTKADKDNSEKIMLMLSSHDKRIAIIEKELNIYFPNVED